jgi:phosphoserine phosphatase RsbU/P
MAVANGVSEQAFLEIRAGGNDGGGGAARRIPLTGGAMVIGRAADSQILLESTTVSRHHAELRQDESGRWIIRDMGSRNGTLINGRPAKEQVLYHRDQIQIGSFQLALVAPGTGSLGSGGGDSSGQTLLSSRTDVLLSDGSERLSTLKELEPPKVAASHLTTLNQLSQELLLTADPLERAQKLCQLIVSPQFHAEWAALLRLRRGDGDPTPEIVCDAQGALSRTAAGTAHHVSRSTLRQVARQEEAVLASNVHGGGGGGGGGDMNFDVAMSIAPGMMAMAAIACPLRQDEQEQEILYVTLPPQYGTGEWLALTSMAAKQYQQAEQAWAARHSAEDHAALERELERARQIQMRLVPQPQSLLAFKDRGIDVAIGFAPSRWVGGDYVDVLAMNDGRIFLVLADVCGHGLAAALVTSAVHTLIHAGVRAGTDVLGVVNGLNQHLCDMLPGDSFVTLIAVALDLANGSMHYVNAGHPPPLLLRSDATEPRQLQMGENLPLGLDRAPLQDRTDELATGEWLALYSDGLTEQTDDSDSLLGLAALRTEFQEMCSDPNAQAALLADQISRFLAQRRGQRPPEDDQSFLLVRRI